MITLRLTTLTLLRRNITTYLAHTLPLWTAGGTETPWGRIKRTTVEGGRLLVPHRKGVR